MIKSGIDATVAGIRALNKAGSTPTQFTDNTAERAAMKRKMNKARDIENMKDDPVWFKQHREDTKYSQWADGMHVMLDDLDGDYELALVEDSLRDSVYFQGLAEPSIHDNSIGIFMGDVDYWFWHGGQGDIKLTRAQALYIATGDTEI